MERKKIGLWFFCFLAAIVAIYLPGFSELQKLREENEQKIRQIKLLEERNQELKDELVRFRSDPEYIEKKAREKLGIVKKGEIIYRGSSYLDSNQVKH